MREDAFEIHSGLSFDEDEAESRRWAERNFLLHPARPCPTPLPLTPDRPGSSSVAVLQRAGALLCECDWRVSVQTPADFSHRVWPSLHGKRSHVRQSARSPVLQPIRRIQETA